MSPVAVPRSLAGTTIMQLVPALCSRREAFAEAIRGVYRSLLARDS